MIPNYVPIFLYLRPGKEVAMQDRTQQIIEKEIDYDEESTVLPLEEKRLGSSSTRRRGGS